MKSCPKCGNPHEEKGTYCSRKCANSRKFSQESIEKKRHTAKAFWENLTPEEQRTRTLETFEKSHSAAATDKRAETWKTKFEDTPFKDLSWDFKRKRIKEEQNHACGRCGISEWLGQPIPLEIDHIDGVNSNDDRDNLIGLCPNCHSLTPTWRGRNKTNNRIGDEELTLLLTTSKNISQALKKAGMSPRGKNYVRAYRLLGKAPL